MRQKLNVVITAYFDLYSVMHQFLCFFLKISWYPNIVWSHVPIYASTTPLLCRLLNSLPYNKLTGAQTEYYWKIELKNSDCELFLLNLHKYIQHIFILYNEMV